MARWWYQLRYMCAKVHWRLFRPIYRGAKVVITCDDEILMIRNNIHPDYWSFPGGTMERGETPEETACREVKEELNIELDDVLEIGSFVTTAEGKKDTVYCFHAEIANKKFTTQQAELAEARWFPLDDLPENIGKKNARKILDCYLQYKNVVPSNP